jgi:hypothetical protein
MVGLDGLLWGWWKALRGCELDTVTGFLHARGPTTVGSITSSPGTALVYSCCAHRFSLTGLAEAACI